MSDETPTTLEEAREMFPDADGVDLRRALRDLRQAARDAECDCPQCEAERERLRDEHGDD